MEWWQVETWKVHAQHIAPAQCQPVFLRGNKTSQFSNFSIFPNKVKI